MEYFIILDIKTIIGGTNLHKNVNKMNFLIIIQHILQPQTITDSRNIKFIAIFSVLLVAVYPELL